MNEKQHFFSFSGRMTVSEFWASFFLSILGVIGSFLGLLIMACILLVTAIQVDVETITMIMNVLCSCIGVLWWVHIAALSRRRLRDAGLKAKSYLWLLLPGIGVFIFIARKLCACSEV